MNVARQKIGRAEVVTISGRVSGSEAPKLAEEFQAIRTAASPTAPSRVVLDVTDLDNLPSAVVGSLVEAIRATEAAGGRLVLAGPNHALTVVLERLGIADLVTTFKSAAEAVQALGAADTAP
jgi:anti-anti-sigma factor